MKLTYLPLTILWVITGHANFSEEKAQILLNARSAETLSANLHKLEKQHSLNEACRLELQFKQIPRSCYQIPLSEDQRRMVDESCKKAASLLKAEASLKHLSPKCSMSVSKKNEDLRYRFREQDPARYILKQ